MGRFSFKDEYKKHPCGSIPARVFMHKSNYSIKLLDRLGPSGKPENAAQVWADEQNHSSFE